MNKQYFEYNIIRLFFVSLIAFPTFTSVYAYDFEAEINGLTYRFNIISNDEEHKTCEITYYNSEEKDGIVEYNTQKPNYKIDSWKPPTSVIWQGDEYKIIGIGDHAFQNTNAIRNLDFGVEIKYIGKEAFKNCYSMVSLDIPKNLETIGESAFENCTSLEYVYNRRFIEWEGEKASLYISSHAFRGCVNLEWIDVNDVLPEDNLAAIDAFDIIDGKINCDLYVTPMKEAYPIEINYKELYEQAEPWKYFNLVEFVNVWPTGIEDISSDSDADNGDIYNLQGIKVDNKKSLNDLVPGLYILNGRKIMKK